jgi:hypothetical protein
MTFHSRTGGRLKTRHFTMKTPTLTTTSRLFAGALFLAAAAGAASGAEAVLEYRFVGTYKKEAAQGMAIYKDTAFLFNNTGIVRLYNLKTHEFVSEFFLDTFAPENHANCANFGVEFPAGNSAYPALYVSECYGQRRCFVESVSAAGAKLVQTLKIRGGGPEDVAFDWYLDNAGQFLYAIAKDPGAGAHAYRVTKLRLPRLADGDVTFTPKDFLAQFTINFRHLSQGGVIRGDYLYLPVGHLKPASGKNDPRDRGVLVVNLRTQQIEKELDLNQSLDLEPEDADFHGDSLLMYCGQTGGLWRVSGL